MGEVLAAGVKARAAIGGTGMRKSNAGTGRALADATRRGNNFPIPVMLAQASIHLPASTCFAMDAGLRQHDKSRWIQRACFK
jgi:hypothetical protein